MFFHPLNLLVVALVVIAFAAWALLARNDVKGNPINYGALTLATGMLIRSFANEWWAQVLLSVIAAGGWLWYLTVQHGWPRVQDRQLAAVVGVAGVVLGVLLREVDLWLSLFVGVAAVLAAVSNLATKLKSGTFR